MHSASRRSPVSLILLWLASLLLTLSLYGINREWGSLNQDEGWYLQAARQVNEGALPYRDFAFTQGPVAPYVYAWAWKRFSPDGVGGGRCLTAGLGLIGIALAAWLAACLAPPGLRSTAALLVLMLLGINAYQTYFTTLVKTYSLALLPLLGGWLCWLRCARRGALGFALAAGLLLALAAATRLSAGAALLTGGLGLLALRKSRGDRPWIFFGVGGILGLGLAFGPFLLSAREGLFFGLLEYHAGRNPGDLAALLIYKAGFISRMVQAYFVAAVLGVALFVAAAWRRAGQPRARDATPVDPVEAKIRGTLWSTVLLLSLVHFAAGFPYDDYQVIVYPLAVVLLAAAAMRWAGECPALPEGQPPFPRLRFLLVTLLLANTAAAFSSPVNQDWLTLGRDRIWWRLKPASDLQHLQEAAEQLARAIPSGRQLLTQDAYLAVEADLKVPPGLEMGPFSYFPEMSDERAARLKVLNRSGLRRLLSESEAPVAALSGFDFCIACPGVSELPAAEQEELRGMIRARYAPWFQQPDFGQGHTLLEVFRREVPPATQSPEKIGNGNGSK